tara:strand:- start:398 stop:652 length:255 start_codon:yes stop_codon:yes gene_type:complete
MKYNVTYVYDHAVITITVNAPNQDLATIAADEMLGDWGDLNDVTVEELESETSKDSYRFGDNNPLVSVRNYRGRGGHETWGTQR